jgi:hypothetical protein
MGEVWWNARVEIVVPFDTPEEAAAAFRNDETMDRLYELFGDSAVMRFDVEEAVEGAWPY